MSLLHFLASSKELPIGEFGGKKVKDAVNQKVILFMKKEDLDTSISLGEKIGRPDIINDDIAVYESYEDAAGIYITKLYSESKDVEVQFKNKFLYSLSSNFGDFQIDGDLKKSSYECYKDNRKCISTLIDYIITHTSHGESTELYTCWAGEEAAKRDGSKDWVIDLSKFVLGETFQLKEKQYINFKR